MTIEFECPACDTLLRTPDRKAGQSVNCPACEEPIWVPYESTFENLIATTSADQAETESWRRGLPSESPEAAADFESTDAAIAEAEFSPDDEDAESCAYCGGLRSSFDTQCRACGAGFLGDRNQPNVIPRDVADIFRCAWTMFSKNAGLCVFASLIDLLVTLMGAVVVLTPAIIMLMVAQNNPILGVPAFFVLIGLGAMLVYASVTLGHAQFYFKLASGERPDVFSILHVTPHLRSMLIATLIYFTCVAIGLVLFILPGLLLAAMWGMYPFVLVHKNTGPVESLREAWALGSRNAGIVVTMAVLSFVVLQLVSAIPGAFLVVLPFTALLQTYLYLHLSHHRPPRHR